LNPAALKDQVEGSRRILRKKPLGGSYGICFEWALTALEETGGMSPGNLLLHLGVTVVESEENMIFGSASVLATTDLTARRITLYISALPAIEQTVALSGIIFPCRVKDVVTAHEIFHLLKPDCPEDIAETGAHIFATLYLKLPFYAGLLADSIPRV
jgi:hypothetical protein